MLKIVDFSLFNEQNVFIHKANIFIQEKLLHGFTGISASGKTLLVKLMFGEKNASYSGDIFFQEKSIFKNRPTYEDMFLIPQLTSAYFHPNIRIKNIFTTP